MQKILKFLKKLWSSITFRVISTVCVLFLLLLMLINVLIVDQSKKALIEIFSTVHVSKLSPTTYIVRPQSPGESQIPDVLYLDAQGRVQRRPLAEIFTDRFTSSLITVAILAVGLAILIGLVVTYTVTNPLLTLMHGINRLKKQNYKTKLKQNGTKEFVEVIQTFNELTAELSKLEELRKNVISDTSHELKTPLTALKGQLEAMQEGVLKPSKQKFAQLIEQVDRLNSIVDKLQTFTRIRNKNSKLQKKPVLLHKTIALVADEFEIALKKAQIDLKISVPKDQKIMADKYLLEQLLTNLFENTLRYAKASKIFIGFKNDQLSFRDNGIGVPNESLKYIFERFYKVDSTQTSETRGLGLGLAIVKEIAEAHGWKVEARNRKGFCVLIKNE